jgi:hypothetical protein
MSCVALEIVWGFNPFGNYLRKEHKIPAEAVALESVQWQ